MSKKDILVRVEWEDSSSRSRIWNPVESLKEGANERCTSIGYLVHSDTECVVVAAHKGSYDYAGDMRIPKRAIVKMRRLKEQP